MKSDLAYYILEKFKSETYLIKGDYCEEDISSLKLEILLEKYNKKVCQALNTNIE